MKRALINRIKMHLFNENNYIFVFEIIMTGAGISLFDAVMAVPVLKAWLLPVIFMDACLIRVVQGSYEAVRKCSWEKYALLMLAFLAAWLIFIAVRSWEYIQSFITYVWHYSSKTEDRLIYNLIMTAVVGLCVLLLFKALNSNKITSMLTAVSGCGFLIYTVFCDISIKPWAAAAFFAMLVINLVKKNYSIMPFVFAIMLVCSMAGYSSKPYSWNITRHIVSSVCDVLKKIPYGFNILFGQEEEENDKGVTGYTENGEFGGGLLDNHVVQLKLYGTRFYNNLYLAGNTYNEFTNAGWNKSYTENDVNDNAVMIAEYLIALSENGIDYEQAKHFSCARGYDVEYQGIRTHSVFLPKMQVEYAQPKDQDYETRAMNAYYKNANGQSFSYTTRYIENAPGSSQLIGVIRNSGNIDYMRLMKEPDWYERINKLCYDCYGIHLESIIDKKTLTEHLETRTSFIYDNYTAVPDCVSERVRELAVDITKEKATDYDRVKAIESYLRTYTYSKNPAGYTTGQNILDTFLFEQGEGYCVHFASAMAVLARCAGIPSRYTEGFCVDFEDKSVDGGFNVTGNNAHAWAEVYIKGYGWLRLEATPGYESGMYGEWDIHESQEADYEAAESGYTREELEKQLEQEAAAGAAGESGKKIYDLKKIIHTLLHVLLSLVLAAGITVLAVRTIRRHRYKRMSVEEKYWYRFFEFLKLLEKKGIAASEGETYEDFFARISIEAESLPDTEIDESIAQIKSCFERIYREYMGIRYGGETASIEKREMVEKGIFYVSAFALKKKMVK